MICNPKEKSGFLSVICFVKKKTLPCKNTKNIGDKNLVFKLSKRHLKIKYANMTYTSFKFYVKP